jgi:hypothetical protein
MRCVEKSIRKLVPPKHNAKKLSRQEPSSGPAKVLPVQEFNNPLNAHESEHTVTGAVQIPEQLSVTNVQPAP